MSVNTQANGKQYIISDEELQRIHEIQKEMIREINRICKKNHIHYNMVGGNYAGSYTARRIHPLGRCIDTAKMWAWNSNNNCKKTYILLNQNCFIDYERYLQSGINAELHHMEQKTF